MRAVVQRVLMAMVAVDGACVAEIGAGLVVLLGIGRDDSERDAVYLAEKCVNLRVFDDAEGVMNRSLLEVGGDLLLVSQFTLMGDVRKGRRPSYSEAAPPPEAEALFQVCTEAFAARCPSVQTGIFQADMQVALVNNGPVTILLDSKKNF